MATEPWKRPWEEHQHHQSPPATSPVGTAAAATQMPVEHRNSKPLFASAVLSATVTRRLPPLHAGVDHYPPEPNPPPRDSRRTSVSSTSNSNNPLVEQASPTNSLAWQYGSSASSKRRRLLGSDDRHDDGPPPHAYSSASAFSAPDHHHHRPPSSHQALRHSEERDRGPFPDQDSNYGGHTTRTPALSAQGAESANGWKPHRDLQATKVPVTPCCTPLCAGDRCRSIRNLVAELTAEFADLDMHLRGAIGGASDQTPQQAPDVDQFGVVPSLEWVLERVRMNTAGIRALVPGDRASQDTKSVPAYPEPPSNSTDSDFPGTEVAPAHSVEDVERQPFYADKDIELTRQSGATSRGPPPSILNANATSLAGSSVRRSSVSPAMPEVSSGHPYLGSGDGGPASPLPHLTYSSNGSTFNVSQQQAPMHGPHHNPTSQQHRRLPSPSSLQHPPSQQPHSDATSSVSMGGPSPPQHQPQPPPSPAHMQHLQDLQHQVTVKTLALQTLQREYDSLLARLERQRTKCLTLEKKFSVSDVEINSLTDERERLQSQVQALEAQAEELTKTRDDARKEMAESGRQYVRILEMANRLQAQGADERKKWEDERKELLETIRALEQEASAAPRTTTRDSAGQSSVSLSADSALSSATTGLSSADVSGGASSASRRAPDVPPPFRAEIEGLRARTEYLETTVRRLQEVNRSMQNSLEAVSTSAAQAQSVMDRALGASSDEK